jgi:uncharacterized protein YdeI (YjbR/CyaY-like superfamily)
VHDSGVQAPLRVGILDGAETCEHGPEAVPPRRTARPVRVPPYFMSALKKNRKALAAFEGFPPSHRREYVDWIDSAKTNETRQRRMPTAIEWIASGKSRNWKYQR